MVNRDSKGRFVKGHVHSLESRRKISKAHKGKEKNIVKKVVHSNCLMCKKKFSHRPWKKRKFCSVLCANKRPVNFSKEGLKRLSESKKGHKNPMFGKTCPRRKKRIFEQNGYAYIWKPNHKNANHKGYIAEHRLVVEQFIGRPLEKNEIVHHIDEDKKNNDIDNLMVFQSNSEHIKWHIKLKKFGTNWTMQRKVNNRWEELKDLDKKIGRQRK